MLEVDGVNLTVFNHLSELQIRRGIDDNSKIIFLISHRKHML